MNKGVWVLIPAYNEEHRLGPVLTDLHRGGYHNVLVVDDENRDKTTSIARSHEATVIRLVVNRGQGAALKTGFEYLKRYIKPAATITFDADGQHLVPDIQALLEPILSNQADVVLGSRFLKPTSQVPPLKRIVLKAGAVFTWLAADMYVTDTHNGLRALNMKALERIQIKQRGMEHASEIIDEVKRKRLRYKEAAVTIKYFSPKIKRSQPPSVFLKLGIKYLLAKITS